MTTAERLPQIQALLMEPCAENLERGLDLLRSLMESPSCGNQREDGAATLRQLGQLQKLAERAAFFYDHAMRLAVSGTLEYTARGGTAPRTTPTGVVLEA